MKWADLKNPSSAGRAALAVGLAAALFIGVNVSAQSLLRHARLDLTADGLYTLSPGVRNVLAGLREPVTLRLYYSAGLADEAPSVRAYGQRVRELLQEYAVRADGKVRLEIIDPEPYSDAEDRAVEAGLQGAPLDRASGRTFYFGLVGTNSTDRREVIPFFHQDRESFLEYDLTRLIYALGDPKKPVIGVLTDMPLEYGPGGVVAAMRGGSAPYAVLTQLRAFFEVRLLRSDVAEVPSDVTVLMLARPRNLPTPTLYAVDQYVLRGGRAIVFADPFVESEADGGPGMPAPADPSAVPTRLFDAWGLAVATDRFVADPALALEVQAGEAARRRTVPYPAWLGLGPENRDRDDPAAAELGVINVASAGEILAKEGSGVALAPLLTSSDQARLLDVTLLRSLPEPERLSAALSKETARERGERRVLAARVFGTLKSAFPGGPPPPEVKPGDVAPAPLPLSAPHLAQSAEAPKLLIFADSDFLEDRFWVEQQTLLGRRVANPFAGNGDLVLNVAENMAGGADLISLRGRAGAARPFTLVDNLRRAAGEQMLAREDELVRRLREAERRIGELQSKAKGGGGAALLSEEERKAIEDFRAEALAARKELRDVQHALNKDIERLAATVKAVNIVGAPLLVGLAALALAAARVRTRRTSVKTA
jgi:ABC-type uncharacterized transport system involved in gliding motility auxiliary subunit